MPGDAENPWQEPLLAADDESFTKLLDTELVRVHEFYVEKVMLVAAMLFLWSTATGCHSLLAAALAAAAGAHAIVEMPGLRASQALHALERLLHCTAGERTHDRA